MRDKDAPAARSLADIRRQGRSGLRIGKGLQQIRSDGFNFVY